MSKNRKSELTPAADVLQSLFEDGKSPLSDQFVRWRLWSKWVEFVGPTIAQNTEPVGYNRGTLWIWVKNSTWMQQLVFMKDHIKQNINTQLRRHYVEEVRFTLNKREVPDSAKSDELIQNIKKF